MKIIDIKKTIYPSTRIIDFKKYEHLDLKETILQIISVNTKIADFWKDGAIGWAPSEVSELLSKSRMDRMVSFSYRLDDCLRAIDTSEAEAHLISSWATLGSLVESSLTLFFTIWRNDYVDNGPRYGIRRTSSY